MQGTGLFGKVSRRQLLKATTGLAAGLGVGEIAHAQSCLAKEGTVRDRLWLFGVPPNVDYPAVGRRSLMTPAEGAFYLSIPNTLMVQVKNSYGHFEPPFAQYAIALRPLKRVVWSIVGASGYTSPEYRTEIMELAKHTPNIVGLYMDDFFTNDPKNKAGKRAALTVDELRGVRRQAREAGKELDIWVTFYTDLLDLPLHDYLELIDVLTLWTWRSEELKNLESNFRKTEQLVPHMRKTLGCYFFDLAKKEPIPVPTMQRQCEMGLDWLREGRIEGIVFLGNAEEDLGLESVEWTRKWIQKVGNVKL